MTQTFAYLRELNMTSLVLRLVLAAMLGGFIGLERGRKRRPAGFRTYMLVCLGAALTMLIGQYNYTMLHSAWRELAQALGVQTDVSRLGAQVINGVGFLGAGTVLVTSRQEVKGLTTAAGLWASACMGLAIGAGFYECVLPVFLLILASIQLLPFLESFIVERTRNMKIFVEFLSLDHLGGIIAGLKGLEAQIYSVEVDHGRDEESSRPSAVFSVRMKKGSIHEQVLAAISEVEGVVIIEEL